MIQVGLTLCDENGNTPPGGGTWQFNFKFDLKCSSPSLYLDTDGSSDTYAQDSIDMLSNSAGIDFSRSLDNGIDQNEFGELLITSGLVLLEDVTWITFTGYPPNPLHRSLTFSGYDLGYLLKTMTSVPLPPVDTEFFDLLTTYFPSVYGTPSPLVTAELTRKMPEYVVKDSFTHKEKVSRTSLMNSTSNAKETLIKQEVMHS